ncbi:GNAT family N-acetyltransferase [Actinopolymorpha pittospori]|uniref:GNAT superfamily N-acetyltransferase n=1 Tax=Actinopolymorpha pittospori TaxID=648752 RepID=A0A927RH63_9ACTN|nr:GNAT family N-acetyltransferase [Actinopolymorpha pittospori]MBE1611880.1 GNAT superfamily N-acetyltransferase [Actinopolymorpha pittospori]
MARLRPASGEETARWYDLWQDRQRAWCRRHGLADTDESDHLRRLDLWRANAAQARVFAIAAEDCDDTDDSLLGFCALSLRPDSPSRPAVVDDIWVAPEHRRRGHGSAARAALERWCREHALPRLVVTVDPGDPAQAALFRPYTVTAQRMARSLLDVPDLPDGVVGRPMTAAEFPSWRQEGIAGYAHDIFDSGGEATLDDALARSAREFDELLPAGAETEHHSFWVLDASSTAAGDRDGGYVASIWLRHHHQVGRSFVFALAVEPEYRGKGYGRAAMRLGERASRDAGDSVLALNVFGPNTVAINLYTSLGYVVSDQSRSTEL